MSAIISIVDVDQIWAEQKVQLNHARLVHELSMTFQKPHGEMIQTFNQALDLLQNTRENELKISNTEFMQLLSALSRVKMDSQGRCIVLTVLTKIYIYMLDMQTDQQQEDQSMSQMTLYFLKVLGSYLNDSVAAVRACTLQLLGDLIPRGQIITFEIYQFICILLNDVSVDVRLQALDCIDCITMTFQHSFLYQVNDNRFPIQEDVFPRVCDKLNDNDPLVREKACMLLANDHVHGRLNLQSVLDRQAKGSQFSYHAGSKKAVNNPSVQSVVLFTKDQVLDHAGSLNACKISVQNSNNNLSVDYPGGSGNMGGINAIREFACGSLLQAYEDEEPSVRLAGIKATEQLMEKSLEFVNLSIDFLIAMFNDSSLDVRLEAIQVMDRHSLKKSLALNEEQIASVMFSMDDSHLKVRRACRSVLANIRVKNLQLLQSIVNALSLHIDKYKADAAELNHVHECFFKVGLHNSGFVPQFFKAWMDQNRERNLKSPSLTDPYYIAFQMLITAAQSLNQKLQHMLPHHWLQHTLFLQTQLSILKTCNIKKKKTSKQKQK
ncbi:hypothetical protein MIR68_009152 [Amoeboaphelidium protococcarum]|nr:hypothetical protein MIR68_009152 [Amoeboaphelidium protococcarum]